MLVDQHELLPDLAEDVGRKDLPEDGHGRRRRFGRFRDGLRFRRLDSGRFIRFRPAVRLLVKFHVQRRLGRHPYPVGDRRRYLLFPEGGEHRLFFLFRFGRPLCLRGLPLFFRPAGEVGKILRVRLDVEAHLPPLRRQPLFPQLHLRAGHLFRLLFRLEASLKLRRRHLGKSGGVPLRQRDLFPLGPSGEGGGDRRGGVMGRGLRSQFPVL